jgi:hypothetical protein
VLKVTSLAIAALTVISIVPKSQAMTTTVNPLSIQPAVGNLYAQSAPPPAKDLDPDSLTERELSRREAFRRDLHRQDSYERKPFRRESCHRRSPHRELFDRESDRRR